MSKPLANPNRRLFLAGLAAACATAATGPAHAAPKPVVVLTSFHDEVLSRFEAAFEKAHPEYRLKFIWRMPHDAAPYLRQPGQGGVDVYWAASPRVFDAIAREGGWRALGIDQSGLPDRIGKIELGDPQGLYHATEMAGYGFAVDPATLERRQLPMPADWPDLADPRLSGLIALPIPSQVGFAPPMVEIVLQAFGWEGGWGLWSQIAANAVLIERGATFVGDEVASGRCAVGLSIDFFVNAAIANGAPLKLIYPRHTGLNPAAVAIAAKSANPDGARAFAQFLLSRAGQSLLTHPDLRRLSVRPDSYDKLPADQYRPYAAAQAGGLDYDSDLSRARVALSAAAFEQMLVQPHAEIVELWQRLRRAEAAGKSVAEARRRLSTPPLSEAQAADAALRRQFIARLEGEAKRAPLPIENDWRHICGEHRAAARRLLEEAGA